MCKNVVSPVDLAVVVGMRVGAYVAHAEAAALAVLDGAYVGHGALVVVAAGDNVRGDDALVSSLHCAPALPKNKVSKLVHFLLV